jgi:hypothetical protein
MKKIVITIAALMATVAFATELAEDYYRSRCNCCCSSQLKKK